VNLQNPSVRSNEAKTATVLCARNHELRDVVLF